MDYTKCDVAIYICGRSSLLVMFFVLLCLALVQDLYKDVDLKIFSQLSTVDIVTVGFNLFECKH